MLCEELKYLYTAITRAKRNLVFFDSSIKQRSPFFHYLLSRGLAQEINNVVDKTCTRIALSQPATRPEDWRKRGHEFLWNRLFEAALSCFQNAREPIWALIAVAGVRHAKKNV